MITQSDLGDGSLVTTEAQRAEQAAICYYSGGGGLWPETVERLRFRPSWDPRGLWKQGNLTKDLEIET